MEVIDEKGEQIYYNRPSRTNKYMYKYKMTLYDTTNPSDSANSPIVVYIKQIYPEMLHLAVELKKPETSRRILYFD